MGGGWESLGQSSPCLASPQGVTLRPSSPTNSISVLSATLHFLLQGPGLQPWALRLNVSSHHGSPEALVPMAQGETICI